MSVCAEIAPKVFYFGFEGFFLAILIHLNWEFLTTEKDGIMLFIITT